MRRRSDDAYDFQITANELTDMQSLAVPKILRPLLNGGAQAVNAKTRAYVQMTRLLRVQAAASAAEVEAIRNHQELEHLDGELTDITEMRRQMAAMKKDRDDAIDREQQLNRLLEVKIAQPAIAVHAKGTK